MPAPKLSRRDCLKTAALAAAGLGLSPPRTWAAAEPEQGAPIPLGDRRELFVDDVLIESLQGVRLEMQRPRPAQIVLACDEPWEGSVSGYFRVLRDGDRYRLWYMA